MRVRRTVLRRAWAGIVLLLWPAAGLLATPAGAQGQERMRAPLPLDVVVSVQGHNGRAPVALSPDGDWLVHTVATTERVERDSIVSAFTATGVPLAEGDARMQATLTHTRTGESLVLGSTDASSWAPVWSPDGERVAFYSDADGEAGLWVWERETRESVRIQGLVPRPFFGYEGPRWSPDGTRLLVKAIPEEMSVEEANAGDPFADRGGGAPDVRPGEPSVVVRRAGFETTDEGSASGPTTLRPADLTVVDVETGEVHRLVEGESVAYYAWSPIGNAVAYTAAVGLAPNSQQPLYRLVVQDLDGGAGRVLAPELRLSYGMEWHWSPGGDALAYTDSGQMGSGEIVWIDVESGRERTLGDDRTPSFDTGQGEVPPLWSADGKYVYAVGGGGLWRLEVASGRSEQLATIPGWRIAALAKAFEHPTIWTTVDRSAAAVLTRAPGRSGVHLVDLETGEARLIVDEEKSYTEAAFNFTGNPATGDLTFLSSDGHSLGEVWVLGSESGELRRGTRLNEALDGYQLAEAELISWHSLDGEPLRGALLLPPGYQRGEPLPLIVWVYGGAMGSNYVNRFGLMLGETPVFNQHVLATRGYAVLMPDAPLRVGHPGADIASAVLPAVNAAVEKGYADPDRVAVMGQSYGAYNVLSLITRSTRFQAAVITASVLDPNLFTAYLDDIGYFEQGQGRMGGSIWEYPQRYYENSPIFRFDRIETPLLIGHGERDRSVAPADAVFNALQRLEKPVEYRLYSGDGHVITRPLHVIDFWERRLEFLAEHLDLEVEPDGAVRVPDRDP